MEGGHTVLDAPHMKERGLQIQHIPLQADHFGHAQPMTIHQQDEGSIPLAVAALPASCVDEPIHFLGR
jgi:hypothetical protein